MKCFTKRDGEDTMLASCFCGTQVVKKDPVKEATSLFTSFVQKEKPLTVLQLLWLNLIMDSLASLALASEPPQEAQLQRPPVNRSASIITGFMWYNMLCQSFYEVVVITVHFFRQEKVDELLPFRRLLARSSPKDKQNLAKDLQNNVLFIDKEKLVVLKVHRDIIIFLDRQVGEMTGDGTNDARPRSCRHRFRHGHRRLEHVAG